MGYEKVMEVVENSGCRLTLSAAKCDEAFLAYDGTIHLAVEENTKVTFKP